MDSTALVAPVCDSIAASRPSQRFLRTWEVNEHDDEKQEVERPFDEESHEERQREVQDALTDEEARREESGIEQQKDCSCEEGRGEEARSREEGGGEEGRGRAGE